MRRADEDGVRWNARSLSDGLARVQHHFAANSQAVNPYNCDAIPAIVHYDRSHLAGIVKTAVIRLPISAGLLHADLWRDVSLGEAGFHRLRRLAGKSTCHGKYHEQTSA